MLLMSDFYKTRPFADPFCGSGTFLIESAFIAQNIAPNIGRKFAFNEWRNLDSRFYKMATEQAKDNEDRSVKPDIRGFDADKKAVELALYHAKRAGVDGVVKAAVSPVKYFTTWAERGTVVTNPPYGERVYGKSDAERCYTELGAALKNSPFWSCFVITPHKGFEKYFGKKCDRIKKLYNAEKECGYYFYYPEKETE